MNDRIPRVGDRVRFRDSSDPGLGVLQAELPFDGSDYVKVLWEDFRYPLTHRRDSLELDHP